MDVRGKEIYVGLSGGVDSAVSAALLKDAGARVTGVFIKGWYPPGLPCSWAADRRDAMRVAAHLHIPFRTLPASREYKEGVIEYLLREYRAGRTPNPDVMCNREVKFGAFYRYAKSEGADAIATGHYRMGEKDQTYFLWAVPAQILSETVFPVGHMSKGEVRRLAARYRLPVAEKKDSQGVCFLGDVSLEEFLRGEFGEKPGDALDTEGAVVGRHRSALLYTIGERVSLDAALPGPWYVQSKDIHANTLVVSRERVPKKSGQAISFADENWHGEPVRVTAAQFRYRGPRVAGQVSSGVFLPACVLPEPPAPGQSIVFYGEKGLVGGGILS